MKKRLLNILIPTGRGKWKRLILDVVIVAALFGAYFCYTHWSPELKLESEHYIAFSTASTEVTRDALDKAETLFRTYSAFWDVNEPPRKKLMMKIYASREELKRVNPLSSWAEAFYRKPYCHQYIDSENELRPYHWMIHEATHQLHNEVSYFILPQWADEGLACYFSTSKMEQENIRLGVIDRHTYPAWWLDSLNLSGDLSQDKAEQRIMSIKSIVNDEKPLNMNEHFNLYYIHWFSLVHFLLEGEQQQYRQAFIECLRNKTGLLNFEKNIGPYSEIEPLWYQHLSQIIDSL